MSESKVYFNPASAFGHKNKAVARKLYEERIKCSHKSFQVKRSGLVISRDIPMLRASPDGLISCKCCGNGTLEIKCPYNTKMQAMTGEEITREGNYHLEMVNNEVHLNHNSQNHLGILKHFWCDFIIFTQKD